MKYLFLFFIFFLLQTNIFAEDFSEMSTQELIEIIGYVKKENQKDFEKELKSRVSTMSKKEKENYLKNIEKLRKK